MTREEGDAALQAQVEKLSERVEALEKRIDHLSSNEAGYLHKMQQMKEGLDALDAQTPADHATREVMWQRIEALEGAPSETLPPMMAEMLRRLAALEERLR